MNTLDVTHGGVHDAARRRHGHAARSRDTAAETSGVVTIEMKTSFMRPGVGPLSHGQAAAPHGHDGVHRGTIYDAEGAAARMPPAPSST